MVMVRPHHVSFMFRLPAQLARFKMSHYFEKKNASKELPWKYILLKVADIKNMSQR